MENKKKYLIYNPGNSTVVYDDGKDIAPGEMLYTSGNRILGLIESGKLIQKPIPNVMPDDVRPEFYAALREAFDDAQKDKGTEEHPQVPEADSPGEEKPASTPVRNTGSKSARKTQDKEA